MIFFQPIRCLNYLAIFIAICSAWAFPGNLGAQSVVEEQRLRDVLFQATSTFQSGDYAEAIRIFDVLEDTFGREPELQKPNIQRVLLSSRGYAEFALGNYPETIVSFSAFLDKFPETGTLHSFVLHTLAQAYQLNEEPEAAADRLAEFSRTYPNLPEAELAVLQRVDILFQSGSMEDALALVEGFTNSNASGFLKNLVQLRALQILVEEKQFDQAAEIILSTDWQISRMSELGVLAFSALQVGDARMRAESYDEALRCYRLVPPYKILVERQRQRLQQTQQTLAYRKESDTSTLAAAWINYYARLVARLEGQLRALEEMQDFTGSYLLRYGQAFLQEGRAREAIIVFRDMAQNEELSQDIREQGHYRWVLAHYSLQEWEKTLAVALEFQENYPESQLAPETLYLVAQAYQEQGKYRPSIEIYGELLDRFPDHLLAPRWLFTRGFNLAMLEQYEDSRDDFSLFSNRFPEHPLMVQAKLWHGLTHHFEGNYEAALAELEPLAELAPNHHLNPEIRYRIATAYYGLKDYETAKDLIEAYLADYPSHQRSPEAVVLRGDILMGMGQLIDASAAFAQVTPEAAGLFPYAIFQRGKIFKALERYDLMIDHFSEYLDREDLELKPRMSEALYWLGWAYLQAGETTSALNRFDIAIEEFGNDPSATEMQALLSSLESIRVEVLKSDPSTLPDHPIINAESFSAWLDSRIEQSLASDQLTWFSRLKYFQANRKRAVGDEKMNQTILQEIDEKVPLDQLDPQIIGQIGLIYSEAGYRYAEDYFDFILENYPTHPARAEAWFGQAQILLDEDSLDEANDLLRKFDDQLPLHPLAIRVKILRGEVLTRLGYYDDAEKIFEEVLQLKHARGIPHANALAGLAKLNEERGNPERAIPYWQRIYTLYRAYPDQVAEAYYRSSELFQQLGKTEAAFNSLEEMLSDDRLLTSPYAAKANALRRKILESRELAPKNELPVENSVEPEEKSS